MKLIINSKAILAAVQSVGSLIKPSSMPILENVLFHFEDSVLTLEADNLEVRSSLTMEVDFFGSYFTLVPYTLLVTMLKSFPDALVEFEFSDKQVTLTVGTGVYHIPVGGSANDYPKNKSEAEGDKVTFNSLDVVEALKKAASYASNDSSQWDGTIILWIRDDGTKIVGGSNKAVFEESIDVAGNEQKIILTKSAVSYLVNSIAIEEDLQVCSVDNKVFFFLENRQITIVRSNVEWPNYEGVFNSLNGDMLYKVDKDSLTPCLRRLSVITDKDRNNIKMTFNQKSLELEFTNRDLAFNAKESIECEFTGETIETGFPVNLLLTTLGYTQDNTVMKLTGPLNPCVISQGSIRCLIAAMKPAS